MDDLIDRQAAIDAILQRLDALKGLSFGTSTFRDGIADGYARIMSDLKALPSAQQWITATSNTVTSDTVKIPAMDGVTDYIRRQDAIDALMSLTVYKSKREIVQEADKNANSWICGVAECIDEIEDLLSAKPEPSIPISWIKEQINWLKGVDNGFAKLSAMITEVLLEKWMKGKEDERIENS